MLFINPKIPIAEVITNGGDNSDNDNNSRFDSVKP